MAIAKLNEDATKMEALQQQVPRLNEIMKTLLKKLDEKDDLIRKILQRNNARTQESNNDNKMDIPTTRE